MIDFRMRAFALILAASLVAFAAGCGSSDETSSPAADTKAAAGEASAPSSGSVTKSPTGVTTRIAKEGEVVDLPEGYPSDFPVYPGARPTFSQDASASASAAFQTEDPGPKVYEYFSKELPGGGWTIKNDTQLGGKYMLTAEKNGREVSLFIPQSSDGVTTILLMSKS